MKRTFLPLLMCAVLQAQGCGNSDDDPSYTQRIAPIFDRNCATSMCHATTTQNTSFVVGPSSAFGASMVLANTVGRKAQATDMSIITPGDAEHSFLYRKITGTFDGLTCMIPTGGMMPPPGRMLPADRGPCGFRMPIGVIMTDEDIAAIRNWINMGAKEN